MYKVKIKKKAMKELLRLPEKDQERVIKAFDLLRENPFAGKKLHGDAEGSWTLRIWPYRIIYIVQQDIVTVTVVRVGHRQGVYKS